MNRKPLLFIGLSVLSCAQTTSDRRATEYPLPPEVFLTVGRNHELFSFGPETMSLAQGSDASHWFFVRITSRSGGGLPDRTEICLADRRRKTYEVVVKPENLGRGAITMRVLSDVRYASRENAIVFLSYVGMRKSGLWVRRLVQKDDVLIGYVGDFALGKDADGDDVLVVQFSDDTQTDPMTRPLTLVRLHDLLRTRWKGDFGDAAQVVPLIKHIRPPFT